LTPPGEDERLLKAAGFELLYREDSTEDVARLAYRRFETRDAHREELLSLESQDTFERMQRFLAMAAVHAGESRLSRTVFLARKARDIR
jgi:hypothetical protein